MRTISLDSNRMFPSFHVFCLMLAMTILSAKVSAAIDAETIRKAKNGEWFSLPYDEDDRFLKIVTVSTIGSGDGSYENAQEYCRREGSYLMTIHSQADMDKITEVARNLPMYDYVHLLMNCLYTPDWQLK
ncbi:hypothetical protein COOONC_10376 [Cooperia oncophora]